jgi:hypothetical protein
MRSVRHRSSVTSLSWIPSEAIEGSKRIPFDTGWRTTISRHPNRSSRFPRHWLYDNELSKDRGRETRRAKKPVRN